ncbi:MAG: hypothetical protein VW518_11700 [Burkholderiaceae bacterium]
MNFSHHLFSNIEYYRNNTFVELMRKWNSYMTYEGEDVEDEDLMFEWEELLLKDILFESKKWLKENRNKVGWRKDLV